MEKLLTAETIINQDVLRQVENLCVQEEPPACTSACPLQLDVRQLMGLIQQDKMDEAYKLYAKAVPFAPIIARTCSAPCQKGCKRADLGGSIQVQQLEKALCSWKNQPSKPPFMLPKKTARVAVIGGGMRGLAAANDLARKGYKVTILDKKDTLGGRLREYPLDILPAETLDKEIECLLDIQVVFQGNTYVEVDTTAGASALLEEGYEAVFIACDSPLGAEADPFTLETTQKNILAGRCGGRLDEGDSTIYDLFDGRSAATTIDRLIQGVSVTAGREKEGSTPTRLYTNLEGVTVQPVVSLGEAGCYTQTLARQEADRCLLCQCMECVKKCAFLQKYKGSPRRYVREVYNNLSIAMGNHDANGMINTCALCSQCEAICPNGLDMAQVFLTARQRMVESGKMPQSAHEFALLDMEYSLSDGFYLAKHQPGKGRSQRVFFPGCQLAASEPELVKAVYAELCRDEAETGLWLSCCGIMAKWAGNDQKLEEVKTKLVTQWEEMGKPKVIAACPSCAVTLKEIYGIEAEFITQTYRKRLPLVGQKPEYTKMGLHHACGARYNLPVQEGVAEVAALAGVEIVETTPENQSPCCGYGGLVPFVNSSTANQITQGALEQMKHPGEDSPEQSLPYLTYCVNCRDRFLAAGQDAYHILELLFPQLKGLQRKNPTWSLRQENRLNLRNSLLKELWGEEVERIPDMTLFIGPELADKLEETHILHSDIKQAIQQAEENKGKFADGKTGHFITQYRPGNVTFWVEYLSEGDGYRVFNAYCHRMAVTVTGRAEKGEGIDE